MPTEKVPFDGRVVAIQPRIRLLRSFDERSHSYLGLALRVDGRIGEDVRIFSVGIGSGAQAKHTFRAGDTIRGMCVAVANPKLETVEFYRASALKVEERGMADTSSSPPWLGVPPELPVYRERGHRRLSARRYRAKCTRCIWGCLMAVEMTIDHWNPQEKQYRTETFCYGPVSCPDYKPGPRRKVPGRKGMVHTEPDWIDEDAVSDRQEE